MRLSAALCNPVIKRHRNKARITIDRIRLLALRFVSALRTCGDGTVTNLLNLSFIGYCGLGGAGSKEHGEKQNDFNFHGNFPFSQYNAGIRKRLQVNGY